LVDKDEIIEALRPEIRSLVKKEVVELEEKVQKIMHGAVGQIQKTMEPKKIMELTSCLMALVYVDPSGKLLGDAAKQAGPIIVARITELIREIRETRSAGIQADFALEKTDGRVK